MPSGRHAIKSRRARTPRRPSLRRHRTSRDEPRWPHMSAPEARVPARLEWRNVPILAIRTVTPRVKSFALETGWERPYRAGQYVDVRLTAPDGYQAQRSYSMASAPNEGA